MKDAFLNGRSHPSRAQLVDAASNAVFGSGHLNRFNEVEGFPDETRHLARGLAAFLSGS